MIFSGSDILRSQDFFSPGEVKTVRTLPMWFAFIPISELFRSAVLNPLCTLGSTGEFLKHSDA